MHENSYRATYKKTNPGCILDVQVKQSSPVAGLDMPRGFQEVKVPRFRDSGTGWW